MLRDYQLKAVDQIREEFRKGNKKVLLWMATGGGKTATFCHMIKEAFKKNFKTLTIVRGRKLVDQASQRLFREHVPHGVLMSQHWNNRPYLTNQVASVDTLIARGIRPDADLIIIDEAHLATSEGYIEVLQDYPNAFIVAVTATPYGEKGFRHIADSIVKPISMLELINRGYLVGFRYFAPSTPDVSEVKISSSTKDFVTEDLARAMVKGNLTGDIVEHWREIALGMPTLCFAVNIKHSKMLRDKFLECNVRAVHVDADCTDQEREDAIKKLEAGEIDVICNVGIFCTGVDIPCVRAIIMARPTKSLNLYIQQAGRGTRPFEGKDNCILLDHAGNIERHGLPTDEPDADLDGRPKRESVVSKTRICKECFAVYPKTMNECPECGFIVTPELREREIKEAEGRLVELKGIEVNPVLRAFKDLKREAKNKGRKPSWANYKLIDRFGLEKAKPYLSEAFVERYKKKDINLFRGSPFKW